MAKNPPKGYHSVTPALVVRDAAKAIDFYKEAFGAEEVDRMPGPDGSIMHAEIRNAAEAWMQQATAGG